MRKQRPIGYWIKLLDSLIETDLGVSLQHLGISRRQWQILNVVEPLQRTSDEIAVELAPFLAVPEDTSAVLHDLIDTGWLQSANGSLSLSKSGQARLRSAREEINEARARISDGLTQTDYDTTVSTLSLMCRNLGWIEST